MILQADPVYQGSPKGADPLDIRDSLDWLEPIVELDAPTLRAELAEHAKQSTAAWDDWTVTPSHQTYRLAGYFDNVAPMPSRFRTAVVAVPRAAVTPPA